MKYILNMKTILVLCLAWGILAAEEADSEKSIATNATKEDCICTDEYNPVCASDGKRYGNPCELRCAQRQNPYLAGLCKGECPCCNDPYVEPTTPGWGWPQSTSSGCICYELYEPICASNGKTYANSCFLQCAQRQDPYLTGLCKGECPCCKEPYVEEPANPGWGWPTSSGGPPSGGWYYAAPYYFKENKTNEAS